MSKTRIFWASVLLVLTGSAAAQLPAEVGGTPMPSLAPLVEETVAGRRQHPRKGDGHDHPLAIRRRIAAALLRFPGQRQRPHA